MLTKLFNLFSSTLYVQIWSDRIKVTDIKTGKIFDEAPLVAIDRADEKKPTIIAIGNSAKSLHQQTTSVVNPFKHPRSLLSDFTVAEKLLQHVFLELVGAYTLKPRPKVIIQPMEMLDGGLTMIECRAFRELAYGAGAIEVHPYVGRELSIKEILSKKYLSYESADPVS